MGTSILRSVLFVAAAAATAIAVEPARLDSWVLLGGHGHTQMSGSSRDAERVRALAGDAAVLWARRGGQEFLVRDPKLVARAWALLAPLDELGRQMTPLGEKQRVLGGKQSEYGRQMRTLSSDPEHNSDAMTALGKRMSALGEQQSAIGRQQEAIGARMEAVAHELEGKLGALVDEARTAGLAQTL